MHFSLSRYHQACPHKELWKVPWDQHLVWFVPVPSAGWLIFVARVTHAPWSVSITFHRCVSSSLLTGSRFCLSNTFSTPPRVILLKPTSDHTTSLLKPIQVSLALRNEVFTSDAWQVLSTTPSLSIHPCLLPPDLHHHFLPLNSITLFQVPCVPGSRLSCCSPSSQWLKKRLRSCPISAYSHLGFSLLLKHPPHHPMLFSKSLAMFCHPGHFSARECLFPFLGFCVSCFSCPECSPPPPHCLYCWLLAILQVLALGGAAS